ncbi:hypothetical protein CBS101457_003490 [Exobasidium rhododendri]|nr:hypothetical protein CBS101457_003490 [Exobasidium rhododendri]
MDLIGKGNRGSNGGEDRRGSAGYGQHYPSPALSTTSMGPPSSAPSRGITPAPGLGNFASMTGAGFALQDNEHPPSKSSTGGQTHGHRPVSAMPTPTSRSQHTSSRQADSSVLSTIENAAYNDRRASAHPTMSSAPTQTNSMGPQLPISPSGTVIDANAIQNGIPITSPAALQYFAAHPRRQQVHFGNYLLLQTLGEGEFGKVKLGVHKEWGEEVAVKLIKRDKVGTADGHLQITGPSKDPSKMGKVEKEIRVLKDVRHPNIVRLYEVIESDRYIGIVLEYASGGELFDHILAHKYLKERDACRLFAQLISGVSYLHQKKIVHRDLKLENLLLDRNRNVIITDFGFANNFENRKDDLMATSCGSPCYAAPELVVQDGLYAGSAVDVWSCGVILYAMLAGYLPYDDDPKNPEGDNINLLYKYIMATPLTFPEYIGAEPRDLLCKMLVPDPVKRADLETVMAHSWLSPYQDLFRFSVEDLERAAVEQQNKKRMVYRQQMMMQQQMIEQQQAALGGRSNGSSISTSGDAPSVKQQRHQSAIASSSTVPDRLYEAGGDGGAFSSTNHRSRPVTGLPTPVAVAEVPAPLEKDKPRSNAEQTSRYGPSSTSAIGKKSAGQKTQRHTIQLEYDGDSASKRKEGDVKRSAVATNESIPPVPRVPRKEAEEILSTPEIIMPSKGNVPVPKEGATVAASPVTTAAEQAASNGVHSSNAAVPSKVTNEVMSGARQESGVATTKHASVTPSFTPSSNLNTLPAAPSKQEDQTIPPKDPIVSEAKAEPRKAVGAPRTSQGRVSTATTATSPVMMVPSKSEQGNAAEKSATRHRKGMSTDKFFFSRLMSSPSISNNNDAVLSLNGRNNALTSSSSRKEEVKNAPVTTPAAVKQDVTVGRKTSSNRRKAMSLVVGKYGDQSNSTASTASKPPPTPTSMSKTTKEEKRMTARSRKDTLTSSTSKYDTPKRPGTASSSGVSPSSASVATTNGSVRQYPTATTGSNKNRITKADNNVPFDARLNESNSTVGPSSNAAKKVMDWFRKKSLSPRGAAFDEKPPLGPFELNKSQDSGGKQGGVQKVGSPPPPQLIVTNDVGKAEEGRMEKLDASALESVPSSRSTSGTHSHTSQATDATGITEASTGGMSSASGNKSSSSTVQQHATPRTSTMLTRSMMPANKTDDTTLRVHQGAVDQSALTSRTPDEVFEQIRKALLQMGIEVKKEREEDYKLECIRKKRAKTLMGATQGLGVSIRTSVFPPTQADFERSSAARNTASPSLLSTSPSTTAGAGSLRALLRRGSNQQNAALSSSTTTNDDMHSSSPPIYGEASVDGGQEVRFSVEITKIKNLPGLYSVDIRRMKGNLWAYKFLYHALLDRCQLAGKAQAGR